jgi:predicted ATP-dependent protease
MLRDDILEAVGAEKFHIWPVATIEQGIEILMGAAAGKREGAGIFEMDTVYAIVDERLRKMAEMMKGFSR